MRINSKLFFFFLLLINIVYGQELPPILNYSPKDYIGGNQNWDIHQSDSKFIYVANNNGLLEYNGESWKLYQLPNKAIIRSVKVHEEKIFTGSYMEFGYWERDEFGDLIYTSLVPFFNDVLKEDETFWKIIDHNNFILFQSLSRILIFDLSDNTFKTISSVSDRAEIFKVDTDIYFQKSGEGIFKIENGTATLFLDNRIVRNEEVVGFYSFKNKLIIITQKGKFYFVDNGNLLEWNIDASKKLKEKNIYVSHQLEDGSIVIGTVSDGFCKINLDGEIDLSINKIQGLNNNTILSIYEDFNKNLWLGLDNGISVVNLESPLTSYNDVMGTIGSVYTSIIYDNKLYIGTNQGLFYKDNNDVSGFNLIENTRGQVWCLRLIDDTLFCGHNSGTYIVKNNQVEKISSIPGTWDIKQVPENKDLLLQGNYQGLSLLEKKNGDWIFKEKINGFDISSRFFEFINPNEVIVNHEYKGIFNLKFSDYFSSIEIINHQKPKGSQSSISSFRNKLLYTSNNGIYSYDKDEHTFHKDSLLTSLILEQNDTVRGNILVDNNSSKIWGFTDRNIVFIEFDDLSNKPVKVKIPVQNSMRTRMGIAGFENITHLDTNLFLLGNSDGYTILDLDKVNTKDYEVTLNGVFKKERNLKKEKLSLVENPELRPSENTLEFFFSVPEYSKNTLVSYQYVLEGYSNKWSNWSTDSHVTFENLPYGNYTFKVRARVGNTLTSNTILYQFKINKFWYATNLMVIVYIITGLLIIVFVNNYNKKYYREQEIKKIEKKQREYAINQLENEKEIMKLRNDKLRNEISSKTRELSASAMSIVKKNELLTSIKNELLKIEDVKIKPVIKIIDKNLDTDSDWEMFQEAFNSVDRDFLKKVKKIHPNLTPNDLKLCAYLRLNLSSKEIAPLLNISVRSVEIKRYRLRKKMELSHDAGLVEYILNI